MAPDGRSVLAKAALAVRSRVRSSWSRTAEVRPLLRAALARHWRPALPFVLWLAVPLVVVVNWYAHPSCDPLAYSRPCLSTRFPMGIVVRTVAGLVGLAWAGGAYWLFRSSVERVSDRPLGRLLFAPDDRTVAAVVALAVASALFARPLLGGHVTANRWLWLLLAVPYYPVLVGSVVVAGTFVGFRPDIGALLDFSPVARLVAVFLPVVFALLVLLGSLAVEAVWLYLLARAGDAAVAGVAGQVRRWRTTPE